MSNYQVHNSGHFNKEQRRLVKMKQDNRRASTIFSSILITILAFGVVADESFKECIPADTVNAIFSTMFGWSADLNSEIPGSFPEFVLPPHFRVLGSLSTNGYDQVVVSSTLDRQNADESLLMNLKRKGWYVVNSRSSAGNVGFVRKSAKATLYKTLCHEALGQLEYASVQQPSSSVMTLGKYPANSSENSDCQFDDITEKRKHHKSVGWFMPRLELPSKATINDRPTSTNSTAHAVTARIIETKLSSNELFNHFSEQIEAQNWKRDANWKGDNTEGATWTRTTDNDLDLVGTFSIVGLNESNYRLEFWLIPKGDAHR